MTLHEPAWDVARSTAHASISLGATEELPLAECLDRILSKDAHSLIALPTHKTSAMDGYGISGNGPWKIIGSITAGTLFEGILQEGEAIALATGAVIPEGCTSVLRWENASLHNEILTLTSDILEIGKDIRPAGLEAALGDVLLPAGTRLTPGMIGLLAATGYDFLQVYSKPRVALLILGDEIQRSGIPSNGRVRDALGPQLPAWIEKLGCEVGLVSYLADELQPLVDALQEASKHYDILVTTGSTAHGPRDYLHEAIQKLDGRVLIDEVAVRPGHPQLLASINGRPLLGLPGNPQSAVSGLMTIGRALLDAVFGRPLESLETIELNDDFYVQEGFTRMILCKRIHGEFQASDYLGSAMLRGFAEAKGFAIITNPPTPIRWLELPA